MALGFLKRKTSESSTEAAPVSRRDQSTERQSGNGTPDDVLGPSFDEALFALKNSKLAKGRAGGDSVQALPWYLVIGPQGSGKTSFLRHSGLQFPIQSSGARSSATESGDENPLGWWFANEGVFLDVAGALVTSDGSGAQWDRILRLLKQHRKPQSINGLLLVLSLPDLVSLSPAGVDGLARSLRLRVNEVIQQLGVVCPVYLVFSQCDRLLGFREMFSTLSGTERDQIWGATLPSRSEAEDPAKRFEREFRRLVDQLYVRIPARLATVANPEEARAVVAFPRQFEAVQDMLVRFVELLLQASAFQDTPVFRGFYCTSALEQGEVTDHVLGSVAQASGVTTSVIPHSAGVPRSRSTFIKGLLTDVVSKDSTLAAPTTVTGRRQQWLRMGALGLAVLVAVLLTAGMVRSYANNRTLAADLLEGEKQSLRMTFHDDRRFAENVLLLEQFRGRVDELAQYEEEGVPLRLSVGLYRGDELYHPSHDVYFHLFNAVYLNHTRGAVEESLKRFLADPTTSNAANESDAYYTLLKLYLMLSEPTHLDRAYVSDRLQALWDDLLASLYGQDVPKGLPEAVHAQIALYARVLDAKHLPLTTIDHNLVSRVRLALQAIPVPHRYFSRMQREAPLMKIPAFTPEPYSIEKALVGQRQVVLTNKLAVPALFTPDGWRVLFPLVREKVLKDAGQEAWVLNANEVPPKEMEAAIERIYFDEYVRHWRRFIQATKMLPAERLPDIANRLEVLSRKSSQLLALLKDVDKHTRLVSITDQAKGKLFNLLPGGKAVDEPVQKNPVQVTFESFHEFVAPSGEAKEAPVDKYMAELGKAASALTVLAQAGPGDQDLKDPRDLRQARLTTEVLLRQLEGEIRDDVRPLLIQPFLLAQATATKGELEDLNRAMKQDLAGMCAQTVGSRYPFRKTDQPGHELTFTDLASYFHPQSGVFWKFYQAKLKSTVQEDGGRWVVKTSDMPVGSGFLESLRQTDLISQALFGKGTPEPRVAFEMRPNGVPGVDEVRLLIDGRELRYRMEMEEWYQFVWPGSPDSSGATLQVIPSGSRQPKTLHFDGRWGLFRLLDSAHVKQVRPAEYVVEWNVSGTGGVPVTVRFDLKADGPKNPFVPGLFSRFRCPSQVGT